MALRTWRIITAPQVGGSNASVWSSIHLSLSRLNHWLPRAQAHPKVMQGTADFHHQIAAAFLPQTDPVFDNATALDAAVDMFDPQPTVRERLIRSVLLPCQLL